MKVSAWRNDDSVSYILSILLHTMYIYKLVSVSLRKLEYCEGILFLIMNRISDFDEAILSRLHLMLKDEGLSVGARTQICEYLSS